MRYFKFLTPFIRENSKIIAGFIFTLFFLALAIWFIRHEQTELQHVRKLLFTAKWQWVTLGIFIGFIYVLIHGMMYRSSFASIGSTISVGDGTLLYLKRNFISVFLPAGGVSSLAFFSGDIEEKGIAKSQVNFASSIYGFVGILSVLVIAIPVFIYAIFEGSIGYGEWFGLITAFSLIGLIYHLYNSVVKNGSIYRLIIKHIPVIEVFAADFKNNSIERKHFIRAFLYSLLIEAVGVIHIYIAMVALDIDPSLIHAIISYVIAVVFLVISPFLRGLGAVEASMTFILIRLGYSSPEAVSITLLYRFMEFWLQLALGAISFLFKINKLLMRVIPAFLLMALGIINIISVLSPAIHDRLVFLLKFLPLEAITVSNYFVLATGLFLLVISAFMLKGLRMAWYFALSLCILSMIGNLTKAVDYEEAGFSAAVIIILFISRKEYYVKHNPRLRYIGIKTTLLSISGVLLYGTIGFYFLDKEHFNIDFNWLQSIKYTLKNFLLIGSSELVPQDSFAKGFLYSISISGFFSIVFLVYTLVRPYILKNTIGQDELEWAKLQLKDYGSSSMDYFKTYGDKLIYRAEGCKGFLAYRISGIFAVVLESPVTDKASTRQFIETFDRYCFERGLKSIYYRVAEDKLHDFLSLGKKSLFLGQEGIVDLLTFTLEGGSKKSIRNALRKVTEKGFHARVYTAPVNDGVLQKLKSVSDEWLADTDREEIVFSQGMFIWDELKYQTIIAVENTEEKVVAFLNIIPDYVKGEGTYDLIRKTPDAPNGVIDFILVELFNYLKLQQYTAVNLGFAPLSGITKAHGFPERTMKFAYEKIQSFSHYKGLRDSKEKFLPGWNNRYLVYDQDYDLLQVPSVLTHVIKP
ncbi:MAG: phosphatidylglycerol lysyltransferase domain-containing protein [Daejeonella sp.]